MKKFFKIVVYIVVIYLIFALIISIYSNYKDKKEVRNFLGINHSAKIEIIKRGSTMEPPTMFMVIKLEQEIPKEILKRDFVADYKTLRLGYEYFNPDQTYFYKQEYPYKDGVLHKEIAVQGKIVFYRVSYTN